jgi:hypothetical protein
MRSVTRRSTSARTASYLMAARDPAGNMIYVMDQSTELG